MTVQCAVFLAPPRPGEVKIRLAAEIGDQHAIRLYRVMAARTIAAIIEAGYKPTIWYSPADAGPEMIRWLGSESDLRLQASGDLGARLAASSRAAAAGDRWLAIAPDCPGLESVHLKEAADRLENWPVVLGPAMNGGYYLLGGVVPLPDLFSGIVWGSHQILDETRRRLASLGVAWSELPALRIVETAADARASGLLT
ncbi:MAG: TIGR04282 family arsenosugar biosynthesis glycosyltransferase [Gemmatimonadota bacterium]